MLTLTQLIDQALAELQDEDGIRWPRAELLGYFNAGQRALAQQRPDQFVQATDLTLQAGSRQSLPPECLALMDMTHNVTPRQSAISKTSEPLLSASAPNWRSARDANAVVHFMHTLNDPRTFLVYPPVAAGVVVHALVASLPVDCATEQDTPTAPPQWMDALREFVLYRAWSKDAEFGGNAKLAQAHLALYTAALGSQAQSATAVAPTE